jgi:hypothetical protein
MDYKRYTLSNFHSLVPGLNDIAYVLATSLVVRKDFPYNQQLNYLKRMLQCTTKQRQT